MSACVVEDWVIESWIERSMNVYSGPIEYFMHVVHKDMLHRVVEALKKQGEAQYIDGILDEPEQQEMNGLDGGGGSGEADPLYDQAVQIVLQNKRASISLVQRHLRIGYNRAARLIEDMEKAGLVTPMASNGNREIIQPSSR